MSTPIDPSRCRQVKTFVRSPLRAVLSNSQVHLGDLEVPLVMHVYADAVHPPVLTVACTRHWLEHDKQKCEIRVFDGNGDAQEPSLGSNLADFEDRALNIVRTQLRLGPPDHGGIVIRLLQALQMSSLVLSIIVTAAAIAFVVYQVWKRPTALLESKNPAMVVAWLLPGSGLFAVAAWAKGKVGEIRSARL